MHCEPKLASFLPCIYGMGVWFVLVLGLLVSHGSYAQTQDRWPTIALPQTVTSFDVGRHVTVNGMPMRMQGFVSSMNSAELAKWFRQSMGKPLVENTLASKLILGRNQGDYYLTVQLEPTVAGARGVASVTDLKTANDNRAAFQQQTENWLARFPAGSRLLSQMSSEDAGKLSTHLLVTNLQSETLNYERLKSLMRSDGFEIERESQANEKVSAQLPANLANGKTLIFKGPGKEAVATIYRDKTGQTAIVLNIITQMERFK